MTLPSKGGIMSEQTLTQLRILDHFSSCKDPRTRPIRYPLNEIILIVFLSTLSGEEGWEAMVEWTTDKEAFLKELLPFKNGFPCPDTLRRVMERLNPQEFLQSFIHWAHEFKERVPEHIAIDGKTLRHAMDEGGPLHLVTAWSEANRLVLGSLKTPSKSNEITAIKELLNLLVLKKDDVITIDAIGCQKEIISKICEQKADYVIAVKKNQYNLSGEIENFFNQAMEAPEYAPCKRYERQNKGHGRDESHQVWVCEELDWLPQLADWKDLKSIVMVQRKTLVEGKNKEERRYYISSLSESPARFDELIRRHWSIENELHWQLDVTFKEDDSQIGAQANENLRIARMTALELLRKDKTCKMGLKAKMRKCVRSEDYLKRVIISGNF